MAGGFFSGAGTSTSGIKALGDGGGGGNGAFGTGFAGASGGDGGTGGQGAIVGLAVTGGNWNITTSGSNAPGVLMQSTGGNGGNGGDSDVSNGGDGGRGGQGGAVSFAMQSGQVTISNSGAGPESPGLLLISQAGSGGSGGSGKVFGDGGSGGPGGGGGKIGLSANDLNIMNLSITGFDSPGVAAYSLGGTGGRGGDGGFFSGGGGGGGGTGPSGPVTVDIQGGTIQTRALSSPGLIAQSVAGHAGAGLAIAVQVSCQLGYAFGAGGVAVPARPATVNVTNGATHHHQDR